MDKEHKASKVLRRAHAATQGIGRNLGGLHSGILEPRVRGAEWLQRVRGTEYDDRSQPAAAGTVFARWGVTGQGQRRVLATHAISTLRQPGGLGRA